MSDKRKTRFIRVNGRVIPIRQKHAEGAAAGGVLAGSVIAADAARTRTVYTNKTRGLEITRKKFTVQPFVYHTLGDRLQLNKHGKKVGTASYFKNVALDVSGNGKKAIENLNKPGFSFAWLGIKREHRGQGLSNILSKQAAVEMKSQGGVSVLNQVVHGGSLNTNYKRGPDALWKFTSHNKEGLSRFVRTNKAKALDNIKFYRDKKGYITSDIFRETSLKNTPLKRSIKPFMNAKTKLKLAMGVTLAGLSASFLNGGYNVNRE